MPHSSGGGSHSSCSHGSSHSSGSSYSSSRSSSSSSSYSSSSSSSYSYSTERYSRRPYEGATRYVYYDHRGHYHNIYHKGYSEEPDLTLTIIVDVLVSAVAIPIIVFLLTCGVFVPTKINTASYPANYFAEDHTGLVNTTDSIKLKEALKTFQDTTGVSACVEIVTEEEVNNYTDLETYAFSEYLRQFDDELHWLIMVEVPASYDGDDSKFVDWSWEAVIGDDVGKAINFDKEDEFADIIHKYLLRGKMSTIGADLAEAFNEISSVAMKPYLGWGFIIAAIVCAIIYLIIVVFITMEYINQRNVKRAVPVSRGAKELTCKYCGCAYVQGTISVCQHCGAAIPGKDG